MYNLEELNDIQKNAVMDTSGAVLVTAGAGSGKTRLLTHRIAHLINDMNVPPYNILAITFTNKAANEMRERLGDMIDADGAWICTFHSACVRILRQFIDRIGYKKNFTIYGDAETKSIVKRICKENEYHDDMQKRILAEISKAKNKGIAPDNYAEVFKFASAADDIAHAYSEYQLTLKLNNALDYDDLLIQALRLLKENAEAREYFQNKFQYIHIDEFQDTNTIQYDIAKILAGKHGNIFAVGDEDQCIYTWRGATISNIFDFQRDFKCKVYKLEQNYRSTSNILSVANKIIKGNSQRLDKKLWTNNSDGAKVMCFGAATEGFEADYVIRTIYELTRDGEYDYSDCAILFRLNALTRHFEERLLQYGIPHKVFGGFKFYDRKEVKDVLAYARIAANHADDEAAYRIINFPKRGIGDASIEKLRAYTRENSMSVYDAVTSPYHLEAFPSTLRTKLQAFGEDLACLSDKADCSGVVDFFKYLLNSVLDISSLFAGDDESRLENLNELLNSVGDFAKNNDGAGISDYLQMVSLYSDTDEMTGDNAVTLATVHSAKGLEFPIVFVVALEDGIFPSLRVSEENSEHMEEERRLMYVAVTRAQKRLFLSYAKSRFLYGETQYRIPSRFLCECGLVEKPEGYGDGAYSSERSFRGIDSFARNAARYGGERSERSYGNTYSGGDRGFSDNTRTYKSGYGKKDNNEKPRVQDGNNYRVGVKVMHKRLGKGTIIGLEKTGDNLYAQIEFERGGVMLLAVDFAPITVIGE